jgi:hypothetical protein
MNLAYTPDDTTWIAGIIPAIIGIGLCAAAIAMWVQRRRERRLARKYRARRRAQRALPRPAPVSAPEPIVHEGATEAYGAELRAAGKALPSADLRTTGEQMVADHHELAGISDGLDRFSENVMHELRLFLRDDAEYARVARWGGAVLDDTGTFNRRDLDRALAGAVK